MRQELIQQGWPLWMWTRWDWLYVRTNLTWDYFSRDHCRGKHTTELLGEMFVLFSCYIFKVSHFEKANQCSSLKWIEMVKWNQGTNHGYLTMETPTGESWNWWWWERYSNPSGLPLRILRDRCNSLARGERTRKYLLHKLQECQGGWKNVQGESRKSQLERQDWFPKTPRRRNAGREPRKTVWEWVKKTGKKTQVKYNVDRANCRSRIGTRLKNNE